VLLVDDIGMNRDVIGAFLRAAGHVVELAENGQDAVRLASARIYDLILMDVRMPEMDGLEATRQIRALLAPYGQVPIVALTAYFFPDQVTQCQEAGMDGHVTKPVNYATLVQAVARGIARCPPNWTTGNGVSPRTPVEDQPPPKLDRIVLDHLLAFLTPADAAANLLSLRTCEERMLQLLDRPDDPSMDRPATRTALTDTAHALASTAGMFGFTALSVVARRFECAVAAGGLDAADLAQQVSEETLAAMVVLDMLMRESRMLPV
jgi:CheY-like chemotaxis protein/HPt (histidine-containing phosphotransfer) domain-containing protein